MSSSALSSNAHLVAQLKLRDRAAFADFYDRYSRAVYNLCYRLMGTAQDAEDLTQEAFLKAYREIGSLRDTERLAAWLYRLAYNLCLDAIRRKKRDPATVEWDSERDEQEPLLPAEERRETSPERQAEAQQTKEQVVWAVQTLPSHYQTALVLREMENLSYDEIARVLETTVPAIETLLVRARDKFRRVFLSQQIQPAFRACVPYSAYLAGWYDDALPAKRRARVSKHLEHCGSCRTALDQIAETATSYRALAPLVPPLALRASLLTQVAGLSAAVAADGLAIGLGTAAVSVAAAAAVLIGVVSLEQSQQNSSPAPALISEQTVTPFSTGDALTVGGYSLAVTPTLEPGQPTLTTGPKDSEWANSTTARERGPAASSPRAPAAPSVTSTCTPISTPHSTPVQKRQGTPAETQLGPGPQGPNEKGNNTPQIEKGNGTPQPEKRNPTSPARYNAFQK